jgi:DNA-binding CsgD family transcriptional regulator
VANGLLEDAPNELGVRVGVAVPIVLEPTRSPHAEPFSHAPASRANDRPISNAQKTAEAPALPRRWHVVVKHEALAVNRSRRRLLGASELDLDALEARTTASPEERALASDRVARSAEALHGLKPQELRALWLKALGHSYAQIAEAIGWSYTKDYVRNARRRREDHRRERRARRRAHDGRGVLPPARQPVGST